VRTLRWTAAIVLLVSLVVAAGARALTLEPIGSFDQPSYVTSDPGDPDRLFVVERGGTIELVQGGSVSMFADLSSAVQCPPSPCVYTTERGLLSIAFAPDFDTTGHLYVDYAAGDTGSIHIDELTASGDTVTGSRPVLTIPHPGKTNHNGGQLQFGPDGYLYISTGDGGGNNDELHNAQNPNSLLGKLLRIDPRQSGIQPYTVPAGNPFPLAPSPYDTIWSYGLRNPFRFSFDSLTGDLVIGDVGEGAREEVDYAPAPTLGSGADYGWNCREGLLAGPATDPQCLTPPPEGFVDPVFDYPHTDPGGGAAHGCAIIGGFVVRDPGLSGLYGRYLYTDLCSGDVRSLTLDLPAASCDRSTGLHIDNPHSFGEDSSGRIYVVSGNGGVYRLQGTKPPVDCPVPPSAGDSGTGGPEDSYVRIRAERRTVQRGRTAFITVWVSPCLRRKGQPVRLFRGGKPAGTRYLDRVCAVHFHPLVPHRSTFTAFAPGNDDFLAATSRPLAIRTVRHLRRP
jgi:hypothetical protein